MRMDEGQYDLQIVGLLPNLDADWWEFHILSKTLLSKGRVEGLDQWNEEGFNFFY